MSPEDTTPGASADQLAGFDLSEPRRVHVVAAGGAGMSAIARILAGTGHQVSGSDAVGSARLEALAELGVPTVVGHSAHNVTGVDAVVASSAVDPDNEELRAARELGVPVYRRREFLPLLAAAQPFLSVTGTHGKTTTSSMLAVALRGAGVPVSWLIGADVPALGSAAEFHPGRYLVLEADESDGSFLAGPRAGALVTNLEVDHLEFWGDWQALRAGFVEFAQATNGPVVLCADDPGSAGLAGDLAGKEAITYGADPSAEFRITDFADRPDGSEFVLAHRDHELQVRLGMPGSHNALNATGALALVGALGYDLDAAAAALAGYSGVHRRFETLGRAGEVVVIDDYAHLPSEVRAIVGAARTRTDGALVVVHQPHRYSRTQALAGEFAGSFDDADVVILTELYPAGEQPRAGVSGRLVYDAVRATHPGRVLWAEDLTRATELSIEVLDRGDTLVTVGAGDVRDVGEAVLAALSTEATDR